MHPRPLTWTHLAAEIALGCITMAMMLYTFPAFVAESYNRTHRPK